MGDCCCQQQRPPPRNCSARPAPPTLGVLIDGLPLASMLILCVKKPQLPGAIGGRPGLGVSQGAGGAGGGKLGPTPWMGSPVHYRSAHPPLGLSCGISLVGCTRGVAKGWWPAPFPARQVAVGVQCCTGCPGVSAGLSGPPCPMHFPAHQHS